MASIASNELIIHGLQKSQSSALRKKAKRMGVTPEAYVRDLIEMDLELDRVATTKSFSELAAPFHKSLAGLTDKELDAMARPSHGKARQ